jgi:serine phosphatase RsbU (regulator of sigma subunit)/PAS domain-containing protein
VDAGRRAHQGLVVAAGALAVVAARAHGRAAEARRRFALLAAMAEVADGALGVEETVERITRLLVPDSADVCIIDLARAGRVQRIGVRAGGPDGANVEAVLRRRLPTPATGGIGSAATVAAGEAQLVQMSDELMRRLARDEEDLAFLRSLRSNSMIVVPLRARGLDVGALSLTVRQTSGRRYGQDDLEFTTVLAGRVALALDNTGLNRELREMERQLGLALAGLGEAVTVTEPGGRTVQANQSAADLLGFARPEDLIAAAPGEAMGRLELADESGRPVSIDELPGARLLAGELDVEPLLVRNVVPDTREERWLLHRTSPVTDESGAVVRVVNVIEDITEAKRAELASRLLARASAVLSSSLDYEHTLQQVAEITVPALADWCGVSMPDDAGYVQQVAVAHADPEKVALARRLAARYPERADDPAGVAEVLRDGVARWENDLGDEALTAAAKDAEHLELLRSLGLRSAMVVPMKAAGRVIGALSLVGAESGRRFSYSTVQLAEELAHRAAVAVENSRMYTERTRIATTLQDALRPPRLPDVEGLSFAALYEPAGELNEVGGDFYDVFTTPAGWMVIIGDVSGHGAQAARLTPLARFTLRSVGQLTADPAIAIRQLNATLLAEPELALVTATCLRFSPAGDGGARVTLACCGHPWPLLLREGGIEPLHCEGTIAGAVADETWECSTADLRPGDALLLYTDGVLDTVGAGGRYGEQRLLATLGEGSFEPAAVITRLAADLRVFQSAERRDDVAALALRLAGARVPSEPAPA